MSDHQSGLPVRSESDGTDEKVVVKVIDGIPGGSNQMSVDSDKNAHVEVHGNDPAGVDRTLILSEEGRLVPRGDYHAASNSKPGSVAKILHQRTVTPDETHQTFRPTGVQSSVNTNVHCADVAIRDESGNPYNDSNPMPVALVDSEGQEVNDENESAANVAAGASDTHTFTVTANMKLTQVSGSASGKAKFQVEVDPTNSGTFTRKKVLFNSTAEPNAEWILKEPILIQTGGKIRVTRTNRDQQPQSLYSTISGHTVT